MQQQCDESKYEHDVVATRNHALFSPQIKWQKQSTSNVNTSNTCTVCTCIYTCLFALFCYVWFGSIMISFCFFRCHLLMTKTNRLEYISISCIFIFDFLFQPEWIFCFTFFLHNFPNNNNNKIDILLPLFVNF